MEFCFVNIANPKVNCKVIAEHFSYTTTYLNILMKKELRITMKEYLISIRTERAKDMLSNTLYEVDRISSSCGFSTRDNFTRVFKRVTGMTPSEYRNSFR